MRLIAGAAGPPAGLYDADVVILALERREETLAAIRSALAQTGVSRHVVIIDQGSTAETLARFAALVRGRRDATLLAPDRNHGVAGGRNLGAAVGHGRIIAALDNDAEFATADTLAGMVAALDADPALAVVACRIVQDATGTDDLSSWGYPASLLARAGSEFDTVTFVGAGHAIRRTAWEEVGGYDATLFFCWEEYDFALRAIARGWRLRYHGNLVIRHKVSAEQRVAWPDRRWFQFVRNRLFIGRKCGASWIELAPRVGAYLLKGLRNGLAPATVRAITAAARLDPKPSRIVLPPAARRYLRQHDTAHRGTWMQRLVDEVLARVPAYVQDSTPAERAARRSLSSSRSTTGLSRR